LDAVGLLRKAVALGVGLVQIADNLPLDELLPAELERLKQAAHDLGVAIEVGTRGIVPGHLFAYLELAVRLGSPLVRIVVDTPECQPSESEIVDTLRSLMPAYERAGVSLAIENHDRFRARSLIQILEQIDSPNLGICLDTVNSFGALEGPKVVVAELGPHVVNVHVKDFDISRLEHKMGFIVEGRPAGQGRLDVPWLLETLRRMRRRPNVILELWTPPQDTLSATIVLEDDWARRSVEYLRAQVSRASSEPVTTDF
jgi:sugar phosphate isomerase/epimerase